LNGGVGVSGHFSIPEDVAKSKKEIKIRANVTVIDEKDKEYKLLPQEFIYKRDVNSWYLEP